MAGQKTVIMDADGIRRALTRIAFEIIEKTRAPSISCSPASAPAAFTSRSASRRSSVRSKARLLRSSSWT